MVSKEPFYKYVDEVLAGKVIVGRYIRLAVERFVRDCDRKDYIFDYKEGQRIVKFAALCNHWKGPKAGSPIILDPYQEFYFIQKYGWKDPTTGFQRFVRTVKFIARKTGKTTEAGLESVYHVKYGIEDAAQVWTCATKEDDAIILVNDAGRIIQATPGLKNQFKFKITDPYVRRVSYPKRNAFIAFMTKGQDAVDTSMGFGDECHDWPTASVKQRIESSMGNRLCPSFTNISTAGFDKSGYCYQTLRDKGIKILEGTIQDDLQLIMIYETDPSDDWKDQECWIKPNPNIPFSITQLPYLKKQFTTAINEGGSTETNFKTKNLNMWVDAPEVWIQTEIFEKNTHGITDEELNGRVCYGSLHAVTGRDLCTFSLFFPRITERDKEIHAVKSTFFMPQEKFDQGEMSIWKNYIKVCPGNVIDNSFIFDEIMKQVIKYQVHSIAFPSGYENNEVVQSLVKEDIQCNPINQGFKSMSDPTTAWESLMMGHNIEHFGNPVLKWCNSNTMAIRKGDDLRIERGASRTSGIVAAVNALAQWKTIEANPEDEFGIEMIDL